MSKGVPAMLMRGGTSKGLYFLAKDLPEEPDQRDAFLLSIMGSPDPNQIDGIGGATSLTSKVAVVKGSDRSGIDVDYLFLQVGVDSPSVTDQQNCGNILAGVGPFAIERGLVQARDGTTDVRIFMENSGQTATAQVQTPDGTVSYRGDAQVDGVPGRHAAIPIFFDDLAGSLCGALLPTGAPCDRIDGIGATLIDNGMPCVLLAAADLGISGYETPDELDSNTDLKDRIERIRCNAGILMNLGDVSEKTVPKIILLSEPISGGAIHTRAFIPKVCHRTLGLFAGVSIASACLMEGTVAAAIASVSTEEQTELAIEHPSGSLSIAINSNAENAQSIGVVRTARKLFDGLAFAR